MLLRYAARRSVPDLGNCRPPTPRRPIDRCGDKSAKTYRSMCGEIHVPKSGVKDGRMLVEELERIARRRREVCHGRAPGGGKRGAIGDVAWDGTPREEPDLPAARIPQCWK